MTKREKPDPRYRHHKARNLGLVRIDGHDICLGAYGTHESRAEYNRVLADWHERKGTLAPQSPPTTESFPPTTEPPELSINELLAQYLDDAKRHYRALDGTPSQELRNMKDAIRPVKRIHGRILARSFGPKALRAVRDEMIRSGLARTTVNARINRVRRVFRWAIGHELLPHSVLEALRAVEGLERGRSDAKESRGITPVPFENVEAALPFMPRPVAAMIRLQRLTGCRVGEVLTMRGCDLTFGKPNWEYRPASHKNSWRGKDRVPR